MTRTRNSGDGNYIPAMGVGWLTPLFDQVTRLLMPEDRIKGKLVREAHIENDQHVLDIGCGTGTLLLLIKESYPEVTLTGLDGDAEVLAIAHRKLDKAGIDAQLDHTVADAMPYPDGSLDRVVSSLVFHHLESEVKRGALAEAFRVLRPGGRIAILDIGTPHSFFTRLIAPIMRRLERAADNIDGRIPEFMREAGFSNVHEINHLPGLFGTLTIVVGDKRG